MSKYLSDKSRAVKGMWVEVIEGTGEHRMGTIAQVTQTHGKVTNLSGDEIDLDKWKNIVQVGKYLQNINSLKKYIDN